MHKIKTLIKKELLLYFNSPIAYIFLVVFYSFSSWLFFRGFFLVGQNDMRSFFEFLPWTYLFLISALTMRLWSEEYRQGTVETMLTSSASVYDAVLSKLLAAFVFLAITMCATLIIPFTLSFLGDLDWGVVVSGYIGALTLGAAYISIGSLVSSLTSNQIVSFILSVIGIFFFYILGEPIVIFSLPSSISPFFEFFALGAHYKDIIRGVIDSRDIIYFLSFIMLTVFLNIEIIKSKK